MEIQLSSRSARGRLYKSPSASLLALFVMLISGCECQSPSQVAPSVDPAPLNRLLESMRDRLLLMHDVARYKWNEKKPIADPVREQQLLDGVAEKAKGEGLEPEWVRSFFAAQIEAAKVIQHADFERWTSAGQGTFSDTPDLSVIRERIDKVNGELIDVLKQNAPVWQQHAAATVNQRSTAIFGTEVEAKARDVATEPLTRLRQVVTAIQIR